MGAGPERRFVRVLAVVPAVSAAARAPRAWLTVALALTTVAVAQAQPYRDPELPIDRRVADLLARMTPEEKFWQIFMLAGEFDGDPTRFADGAYGLQTSAATPAAEVVDRTNALQRHFVEDTRLGIPIIVFAEGLHGLVQDGATVFPQAIGLAATFDTTLVADVARTIARECRARGVRQVLSPVVNIATDVRWGRTEETYGEDPWLVSALGVAFVRAFEDLGVVTTPKHFVANVGHGGRDSYPVAISDRRLREVHLPPFRACLELGGARAVMTAYNSYDGSPCSASRALLTDLLKEELGFAGVVLSDAGAVGGANVLHMTAADYPDAAAQAAMAGLDVIFQTAHAHHELFAPPYLDGRIDAAVIDAAVARVLRLKFELGLFEAPYVDPAAWPAVAAPGAIALARRAASASFVLLGNERDMLPLGPDLRSLAVIGPEADTLRLGGYSAPCGRSVTLLEGIRRRAGAAVEVHHAQGCGLTADAVETVPARALSHAGADGRSQPGLLAEYFAGARLDGEPAVVRVDEVVRCDWTLFGPAPQRLRRDDFAVRWTGALTSPVSGRIQLGVRGNDGYRLWVDDALVIDRWRPVTATTTMIEIAVTADEPRRLRLEYHEPVGDGRMELVWDVGVEPDAAVLDEAVAVAARCEAAIVAVGIVEGEFQDRASLRLPGRQEELIRRVADLDKPVVVVITGGSAVTMDAWLADVDAVLMAWYPGEQGGTALADVLLGDVEPGGRLPITFPRAEGQLPLPYGHHPTGRGDDYVDIRGVGLFPFGHGLGYTTFDMAGLTAEPDTIAAGETAVVAVTVTNSGDRAGELVVQLYVRDELASVARPVRELKGACRIELAPGESRRVEFSVTAAMLAMLDGAGSVVVEEGTFAIGVGASGRDIRVRGTLVVGG